MHDGVICLGAGVGLHVGVLGAEKFLDPLNSQVFNNIDEFATAVVAAARVAFRVLIGQHRPLPLEYGARHEVLGGDHFQGVLLALTLQIECFGDLGVKFGEGNLKGHGCAFGHAFSPRGAVLCTTV